MVVFLAGSAAASTVLFGLAQALQATRLELVRTIRGEVTRDARPGRARNVLIGGQVMASALLLVCAAVFLRSAVTASTVDPGLRTDDTLVVEMANEPLRAAMLQAVMAEPSVVEVAASWPDILGRPRSAFAGTRAGTSIVAYRFVSREYFSVLGIDVVRGRGFTLAERHAAVAMVSKSTARQLWPHGDAVGQVLHLEADPPR